MPETDKLALWRMAELMDTMATNFGGKKDLSRKAELWYEMLKRYPQSVVERAINRILSEEHKYFPVVGLALKYCREIAPELAGTNDQQVKMRAWETDPWAMIGSLDADPVLCSSAPCPVCGSVIQFAPRGATIVHDDQVHREARIGYSNIGRPEWWQMGPPVMPPSRKDLPKDSPTPLAASIP